ncbi:alpha/beta hydrolase domain-containing protein [Streptomyces sp. NPDC090499]|uniref:alpha/beta hydrolase domain-containing protein n=1 Tax=Streptomyces sp. NPDC090499 TaxID=3365965 RepID=UPI00380A0227
MHVVTPAVLRRPPTDGSPTFAPYGTHVPPLDAYDYIEEEWIAVGEEDGRPYATTLCVRRPRDAARFSGTVIAEPLHVHGIAPIWIYTAPYIMRSGHAWVEITAQKTTLDMHVKPANPQRYEDLRIEGPDTADFDPNPNLGNPELSRVFWSELERRNGAAGAILAQVGAALRSPGSPFAEGSVGRIILAGHSQTGSVTTYYIRDVHHVQRLDDGSPVYDGFFPSGFPFEAFRDVGVPVVQVMSDGDVSLPDYSFRPGYGGRKYRREDSDKPGDQYRLYELAAVAHMGTRTAPYDDPSLWKATFAAEPDVVFGSRMSRLPHFELFSVGLHHLVEWVAHGTVPPRAERIVVGTDGYFATDEHGNSRGGVRSVQLDVPHSTYLANPPYSDGAPSYLTVGSEEPFDAPKLGSLYRDKADYVERFDRRLDELVGAGWLLAEDAEDLRREARQVEIPAQGE